VVYDVTDGDEDVLLGGRKVDDSFLDDWGSEVAVISGDKFDIDVNELVKFDVAVGLSVLTAPTW
jgi:hypothetical protein